MKQTYAIHKNMKDVCFMILKVHAPHKIKGVWVNISSKDPSHHFPIKQETLKYTKLYQTEGWSFHPSSEEARERVRGVA